MKTLIEILYPFISEEEVISRKLKQLNRYRISKIPKNIQCIKIYIPYYYFEISTRVQVINKIQEGQNIILVDGLTGVLIMGSNNLKFITQTDKEVIGTIMKPHIQMVSCEEITEDFIAKAIYRKYRQFLQCHFKEKKIIHRLFYVL